MLSIIELEQPSWKCSRDKKNVSFPSAFSHVKRMFLFCSLRFWFKRPVSTALAVGESCVMVGRVQGSRAWSCCCSSPLAWRNPSSGVLREYSHHSLYVPWLNLSAERRMWWWCVLSSCGHLLTSVWSKAAPFYVQHCAGSAGSGFWSLLS